MSDVIKQKELEDNKLAGGGEYRYGFHTDIAEDKPPKGLNEDTVRLISAKGPHYTGLEFNGKTWQYKKFLKGKATQFEIVDFNPEAMS